MAIERGEQQQHLNIMDKVKIKFKKDFFKWALISIWAISIIFMFLMNLFVVFNVEGHYNNKGFSFQSYDLTKVSLEIVLALIMVIAIISLLIKKRNFAEKIGIIVSSIIIYQSLFLTIFYNIYGNVANATFDPFFIWNFFRHWLLGLLHIIAIFMILIDTRKLKKERNTPENNQQERKKKKPIKENTEKQKENTEKQKEIEDSKKKKEKIKEKESIFSRKEEKNKEEKNIEEKNKEEKEGEVETEKQNTKKTNDDHSSLSSEDIDALDELNKIVVDEDKETEEEELKNFNKKDKNNNEKEG